MKIKKGDKVLVIKGKNRGKSGKVTFVDPKTHQIKISGINIAKRHMKPKQGKSGGIVEIAMPMDISKVMYLCEHCGNKPVRIGYTIPKSGKKERICKLCKSTI